MVPWYSSTPRGETTTRSAMELAEASTNPAAALSVSVERKSVPHRVAARHPRTFRWFGPCCSLFAVGIIGIPILVFTIGAFFALPLYFIECHAYPDTVNRTAGLDYADSSNTCAYFQWWLYIMGNLTGLATPLTKITVASSHVFSEIIDVLVAVWSLTLAGLVIGVVGGLHVVNVIVNRSDAAFMNRFKRVFGVETIQDKHDREEDAHKQDLMDAVRAIQRSVETLSEKVDAQAQRIDALAGSAPHRRRRTHDPEHATRRRSDKV